MQTGSSPSVGRRFEQIYRGDAYVLSQPAAPASSYVGLDQKITYGPIIQLLSIAGVTDTGTALLLIARGELHTCIAAAFYAHLHTLNAYMDSDALALYKEATDAAADFSTELLKITQEQFDNLESLFCHIGDVSDRVR
ncbi:hypothetical protein C8Q70DRAFT_208606 [Cubamyces menziesii]|nr:hypothetical protein C8Q70DRAFT_208606 [Cubamyces menziesii]